jgi:small subunit ribosomal protein S15
MFTSRSIVCRLQRVSAIAAARTARQSPATIGIQSTTARLFASKKELEEEGPIIGSNDTFLQFYDTPERKENLYRPLSLDTANAEQLLAQKIAERVKDFQLHPGDVGSAPVQIAAMTERINSLVVHFAKHRKDKGSKRGFLMLVSRRKSMMKYLKRKNFPLFKDTVYRLNLIKEASLLK